MKQFEVGVVAHFEAAHRLRGDFGPATRLHGHTYRLEVAVRGPTIRDDGVLCDLSLLNDMVEAVTGRLNYRDLDDLPELEGRNTTAEVVAGHIFEQLEPQLAAQGLAFLSVRLWESPQRFAGCEGKIG